MPTKLELIQQNRASGMSYLEAASAATKSLSSSTPAPSTSSDSPWLGSTSDFQNASAIKSGMKSIDALTAGLTSDLNAVDSNNPDAPISSIGAGDTGATTVGELAMKVSPTAKSAGVAGTAAALSYVAPSSATNTQGNTSTIKGGSNGKQTTQQVVEGQTNKVLGDAIDNYDTNNSIDKNQFENQKLAAEAKSMEVDTELKRFSAEKEALAIEEDRIQKEKAAQDTANLAALQEKERAANAASLAAAQAKSDAAERELQIANDIELQKSNVAFAKMGLTMSTAAVTSAQQIYTTGIYNLSKLKSENAYKMADLQVAVARVEFDHTKVINDIINTSVEKSYSIRKTLNDDIHTIKNSIIDNRMERQNKIDAAIDTYQKALSDNEEDVLDKMNKANDVMEKNTKSFYDTIKIKEDYANSKIDSVITTGKWYMLSPTKRTEYEKAAGLEPGAIDHKIYGAIGEKVAAALKGVPINAATLNNIIMEAKKLMEGGLPFENAVAMSLANSPVYQKAIAPKVSAKSGGGTSSKFVSYQTLQGPDGKPHRYGITADRQTVDLGVSYTSISGNSTNDKDDLDSIEFN